MIDQTTCWLSENREDLIEGCAHMYCDYIPLAYRVPRNFVRLIF